MLLKGFVVAILVANGFQHNEMTEPKKALEEAGATVRIISPEKVTVESWDWYVPCARDKFPIDAPLNDANPNNYDALMIPGGMTGPDDLRLNDAAINFVKAFANKPIAAICHGTWLLSDAELVKDVTLTSYPSIKKDMINAGAHWVDQEVVVCNSIITSRSPEDLPAFNKAMISLFIETYKKKISKEKTILQNK